MTGYTKLFGSIIASTVWRESKDTKILWVTMLAMKNEFGIVEASLPGLADMARLSIAETQGAISILESPDPDSRTPDHEGRRIKKVDGGWLIINAEKYKRKMDRQEQNEKSAERMRRYRSNLKNKTEDVTLPVTQSYTKLPELRHADAYAKSLMPAEAEESLKHDLNPPKPKKSVSPLRHAFMKLWNERFSQCFLKPYFHTGAQDDLAADKLLSSFEPEYLIQVAEKIWKTNGFYQPLSLKISSFAKSFNNIQGVVGELKAKRVAGRNHAQDQDPAFNRNQS